MFSTQYCFHCKTITEVEIIKSETGDYESCTCTKCFNFISSLSQDPNIDDLPEDFLKNV